MRTFQTPRPFKLSEFEGFSKLDAAGKASFTKTVEKWLGKYEEKGKVKGEESLALLAAQCLQPRGWNTIDWLGVALAPPHTPRLG